MKNQLPIRFFILAITSVFAIHIHAENGTFGGGNGTPENPYLIEDAADLNAVRNNLTASYRLTADIDLTTWITENSPTEGWDPIGNETAYFHGNFDGNGKTISGLWMDRKTMNGVGLFGLIAGGGATVSIKDLAVLIDEEKTVAGQECVGGIIGKITNTDGVPTVVVERCYVNGTITAEVQNAGGIIGYGTWVRVTIQNCYATGSVSCPNSTGGILGLVYGAYTYNIINCYATNTITSSTTGAAGGIMGSISYNANANSLVVNITNSIAANPSITGKEGDTSRLVGFIKTEAVEKTTYTDNAALAGIMVNESTVTGTATDKNGADKTAKELAAEATYAGWDFTGTWTMSNGAYPFPVLNVFADNNPQPDAFPEDPAYAYTVDVTTFVTGTGGTISASQTGIAAGNNTVVITLTPEENMALASFLVNGTDKTDEVDNNQYTLTNILTDYTVEATFSPATGVTGTPASVIKVYLNAENILLTENKSPDTQVVVFDATGKLLLVSNSSRIDISSFGAGLYVIKIQDKVTKVIKR